MPNVRTTNFLVQWLKQWLPKYYGPNLHLYRWLFFLFLIFIFRNFQISFSYSTYIILQLQDLCHKLTDLWNLMDTPSDERKRFDHVTSLISFSVDEVSGQGCLALEVLRQVQFSFSLFFCNHEQLFSKPLSSSIKCFSK